MGEKKSFSVQISYADDDTCIFNCLNFEHVLELLCWVRVCECVRFSCVCTHMHANARTFCSINFFAGSRTYCLCISAGLRTRRWLPPLMVDWLIFVCLSICGDQKSRMLSISSICHWRYCGMWLTPVAVQSIERVGSKLNLDSRTRTIVKIFCYGDIDWYRCS